MTSSRGLNLNPMFAVVSHGQDVVICHGVRLGGPDDPTFEVSEGSDSLQFGMVDEFLTASTDCAIGLLFVR